MKFEAHPIANLFPSMTSEDYTRLVGDIEVNGLRESIWLFEDKILDGRHRYRACTELGIKPRFDRFDGDEDEAMLFSLSLNLARRHMTTEQRAAMGAKLKRWESERAKARQGTRSDLVEKIPQGEEGKARDLAGERVGVNGKYVDAAEKIADAAPEVFERMERGEYGSMATAKKVADLEPEQREEVHEKMEQGKSGREAFSEVAGRKVAVRYDPPSVVLTTEDANERIREWRDKYRIAQADLDKANKEIHRLRQRVDGLGSEPTSKRERRAFAIELLGIDTHNPAHAKSRYRHLAKMAHPDRFGGDDELMVLINALYETAEVNQ